jgi:aspartyl-tRNA(Asn)/glutamyl-tRNA(Gln) amidotransferase subunit A
MASELWQLNAAELVEGYRGGAFTPVDALEACLARVAHCQPLLNAFVYLGHDSAMADARESSKRWAANAPLGPLDGVPVSVKDNLHVAAWPTSWGSREWLHFTAQQDERPVARLRASGAVMFGKTNLPEFAMQGYTSNDVFGRTRNPWDLARSPGGSSGGAAAAVASGCGPLALVTDGGGSTRRPASHCGLVGFKPSAGLVARGGGVPELFLHFETPGAIARTVNDAVALMEALAERTLSSKAVRGARILFVPRFAAHPVDAGISANVQSAARQFEAMGHHVDEAKVFDIAEEINTVWPTLSEAGLLRLRGDDARARSLLEALSAAVERLEGRLNSVFVDYDFILTPCTAALPWPVEETHPSHIDGHAVGPRAHAVFTAFANAGGLPAVALPSGFVGECPTGIQLVGRRGADAALLEVARAFEAAQPWADIWPLSSVHRESGK